MSHIVSLIAAAGRLDPALVSSLQTAWGALGDAVWLSPDEAAEFSVADVPVNLDQVRTDIANMRVDVNVVAGENRRKKILIADMDSTMIAQECIDELADEAGVGARVADITSRAMNGELDFEAALIERVGLLKGLSTSVIDHVLDTRINLASGGPALVATMRENGAYTTLVSGGFVQFTSRIAEQLGFNETRANTLIEADGALTGDVMRPILGRDAKVSALGEITARLSVTPNEAIAVGDGANDLGMISEAGLGVALHAKAAVAAVAPVQINFGDLTALLFLQGYAKDEFVMP